MSKIRLPWREEIPAWYEIGIHKGTTLVVSVHPKALSLLDRVTLDSPIIQNYSDRLEVPAFILSQRERWGFGGVIQCVLGQKGWVSYHCPLPVYRRRWEKDASGRDWAIAVRASLNVLFMSLGSCPDEDTDWNIPQLIIVEGLMVQEALNSGALSAIVTPGMNRFLSNPGKSSLESIRSVMQIADEHMWRQDRKQDRLSPWQFKVNFSGPRAIHLSVPGNACGLDPSSGRGSYEDSSSGYRLSPHNVDSGTQQLSLLMGLARLCELGRGMYP